MQRYANPRTRGTVERRMAIIGIGLFVLLIFLLKGLSTQRNRATAETPHPQNDEAEPSQTTRVSAIGHRETDALSAATPRAATHRAPVTTRSLDRTPQEPVGFIVDDYRSWQQIPATYRADGVLLKNGAIQLVDELTSGPRTGTLVSPPLELWQPAMSAPAAGASLPDGTGMHAEISLSADGKSWGPWMALERRAAPDGHQAQPLDAPAWNGSPPAESTVTDTQSSGPQIRYRLTLTSQNAASPVVEDLRIWRNPRM
jgi:hypothetical protein